MDLMQAIEIKCDNTLYPQKLKDAGIRSSLNHLGNYNFSPNDTFVGVIGTRKPSVYGQIVTQKVVAELVYSRCVVVSGFMHGIDLEAHHAAVDNGGSTIGILGYGLNHLYQNTPKYLIERFCFSGALISEYEHNMSPKKWTFAKRNKIIAGLCSLLIVIEAEQKSGSFITCYWANKFNRDVFAVPGSILSEKSYGTNNIIKEGGAKMLLNIRDLSKMLNLYRAQSADSDMPKAYTFEEELLKQLKSLPLTFDQLYATLGHKHNVSFDILSRTLSQLEIDMKVKKVGNLYHVC
jgi:DNA processing protein